MPSHYVLIEVKIKGGILSGTEIDSAKKSLPKEYQTKGEPKISMTKTVASLVFECIKRTPERIGVITTGKNVSKNQY